VRSVLEEALDLDPDSQQEWVRLQCADEPDVQREVEALLVADRRSEGFLDPPPGPGAAVADLDPDLERATEPPRRLGPYRLLRCLGRGGMSAVYLAVRADDEYRQRVAVKILRQGMGPDARRRLRVERQILAALDHPYIARFLFGDTTADGLPFFAMEFVEGLRVDEYCRRRRLSVDERLDLFLKICSAVEYAHRNLVVHRDLKPGNILVTDDGTPKLLDFGIAKLLAPGLAPAGSVATTARWARVLTPAYASPEQIWGEPITTATDVYSLGVLLYELLTGAPPLRFGDAAPGEVERAVREQEPRRPSAAALDPDGSGGTTRDRPRRELHRRLAGDLDQILLKALRKEPNRRYSSVERFAEDLRRHLRGEPVRARKGTLAYRSNRFLKRHRWQTAAGAAFLITVLAFAAAFASQAGRIRRQADQIAQQRDQARHESDERQRILTFFEDVFTRVGELERKGHELKAAETLNLGVQMVGERHEEPEVTADLLAILGRDLASVQQFQQAESALGDALAIRRRVFGEDSVPAALTYHDLSGVSFQLARYEEAEQRARRAVELIRRHRGDDDLDLADALINLATALYAQRRYDEAEPLFRESLAIRRKRLGDEDPKVVQSLNHLGLALASRGRYDEAEGTLRQALTIQRRVAGPLDWTLAYTLNNLAFALQEKGDLDAAEPLLDEAVSIWRKTLADDDPQLGFALQGLGRLYLKRGEPRRAEAVFTEYRALAERSLPPGHWLRAQAASLLGAALAAEGRDAEAEPLLADALEVLRAARGAGQRDTRFTAAALSRLYERTGRPLLAARLRALDDGR
jgi:eukaryotic-like serine/threonine-protein kinase